MIRAVLDANVYVSAAVRPEGPPGQIIDRFLRGGAFEIVMSQAIVEEVLRALTYPKVRKYIRPGLDPELWFEDIVVLSHLVAGEHEFEREQGPLTMTSTLRQRLKAAQDSWLPEIQTCSISKSTAVFGS